MIDDGQRFADRLVHGEFARVGIVDYAGTHCRIASRRSRTVLWCEIATEGGTEVEISLPIAFHGEESNGRALA